MRARVGSCRPECAEHAMMSLARLVRAIFGESAVAKHKLGFGASLVALGVLITPKEHSFRCELAPEKAAKCIEAIEKALMSGEMFPGTARKLAGRLSWASQFMFRRLGRAMLHPLFQRAHSSEYSEDEPLWIALNWWLRVLKQGVVEEYPWQLKADKPAHLYVDARGVPPRYAASVILVVTCIACGCRCAAVLFIDGCIYYTDGEPAGAIMEQFQKRGDNQITTLEILAIAVGLSSFGHLLRGRRCVIFSDNRGAEGSVIKGASKAWDQCLLIHEVWTLVRHGSRVPCLVALYVAPGLAIKSALLGASRAK